MQTLALLLFSAVVSFPILAATAVPNFCRSEVAKAAGFTLEGAATQIEQFGRKFWFAPQTNAPGGDVETRLTALRMKTLEDMRRLEGEELAPVLPYVNETMDKFAAVVLQIQYYERWRDANAADKAAIVQEIAARYRVDAALVEENVRDVNESLRQLDGHARQAMAVLTHELPARVQLSRELSPQEFLARLRHWVGKSAELLASRDLYVWTLEAELALVQGRLATLLVSGFPQVRETVTRQVEGYERWIAEREAEVAPLREEAAQLRKRAVDRWLDATRPEGPAVAQGMAPPMVDLLSFAVAESASDDNTAASRLEAKIAPREAELRLLRTNVQALQWLLTQAPK